MKTNIFSILFLLSLFISSCSSDDSSTPILPDGDYANGVFVLNQGGTNGGSLSFLSSDFSEVTPDVFQGVNTDNDLGLFLQSIFFSDNLAYIISNGSNMITVVNRNTLEFVDRIDAGLNVPMYGAVLNGKAYVTNQADFSTTADDFVAVIDLETNTVDNTLLLNGYGEKIVAYNNSLFVQKASYGAGNKLSKINPTTLEIDQELSFNTPILDTDIDDQFLYVLTEAEINQVSLNNFEITSTWDLTEAHQGVSKISAELNSIYFTAGSSVFTFNALDDEVSETELFTYESNSSFGTFYGFNVINGRVFIGDGTDFISNGFIQVRSSNGELITELETGLAPIGFYTN